MSGGRQGGAKVSMFGDARATLAISAVVKNRRGAADAGVGGHV